MQDLTAKYYQKMNTPWGYSDEVLIQFYDQYMRPQIEHYIMMNGNRSTTNKTSSRQ
jgi:hypothetical protein